MKFYSAFLTVLFFSVIIFSCSKSSSGGSTQCTLATDTYTATTAGIVTYSASGSGTASLASLTYKGASGSDVTVNNPSLPFSFNLSVQTGSIINIQATGNAPAGDSLAINYSFIGGGTVAQNSDVCGH